MAQNISVSFDDALAKLIRSHKNVLTIGFDYKISRCCNAVQIIAGRLCVPNDHVLWEYREDFEKIIAGDLCIYIQQPLLQNDEIEFTIPTLGEFSICLKKQE
jgi:hypothetical protein